MCIRDRHNANTGKKRVTTTQTSNTSTITPRLTSITLRLTKHVTITSTLTKHITATPSLAKHVTAMLRMTKHVTTTSPMTKTRHDYVKTDETLDHTTNIVPVAATTPPFPHHHPHSLSGRRQEIKRLSPKKGAIGIDKLAVTRGHGWPPHARTSPALGVSTCTCTVCLRVPALTGSQ